MIVVLKARGYIFFFSPENALEPMCINVESNDRRQYAKFWLNPLTLERAYGFKANEIGRVTDMVIMHLPDLKKEWEAAFEKDKKEKNA